MQRKASTLALFLLLGIATASAIGGMAAAASPYGSIGLTLEWRGGQGQGPALTVVSVVPDTVAARAGLAPGDRVVAYGSFADRIALALEGNLASRPFLAVGQPIDFSVQRGSIVRAIHLVAVPARLPTFWFIELRLSVYLLGVLVVGALVALRPSAVTWGFALFVVLAEVADLWPLLFFGSGGR